MNRRDFLQVAGSAFGSAIGAAGVFVVAKAIQCTAEEACPGITAEDRVKLALAELKEAMRAAYPTARLARVCGEDGQVLACLFAYQEASHAVA